MASASSWAASTRLAAAVTHPPTVDGLQRHPQHLGATHPRGLVSRQAAGSPYVPLTGGRRERGHRRVDPVVPDQQVGHGTSRRGDQSHLAAPRPDGRRGVRRGRGRQHPHGARSRLLDGLEKSTGAAIVRPLEAEPVGLLDDHHPPTTLARHPRCLEHHVAHVADEVGVGALRLVDRDVGVASGQGRLAGVTEAAAPVLALQRRGEGQRGVGAPGPGGPGDQPRVGHGGAGFAAQDGSGVDDGILQEAHGATLTDEGVPHGHRTPPERGRRRRPRRPRPSRSDGRHRSRRSAAAPGRPARGSLGAPGGGSPAARPPAGPAVRHAGARPRGRRRGRR